MSSHIDDGGGFTPPPTAPQTNTLSNTTISSNSEESAQSNLIINRTVSESLTLSTEESASTESVDEVSASETVGDSSVASPVPIIDREASESVTSSDIEPDFVLLIESSAQEESSYEESVQAPLNYLETEANEMIADNSNASNPILVINMDNLQDESIPMSYVIMESEEAIQGVSIANIESDQSLGDYEQALELDGLIVNQQETSINIGDLALLKTQVAQLEPSVDQPGFGTQFMIINQYETPLQSEVIGKISGVKLREQGEDYEGEEEYELFEEEIYWNMSKNKDVVWYGRLGSYADSVVGDVDQSLRSRIFESSDDFFGSKFADSYDAVYPVQLNSDGIVDPDAEGSLYSGTLRVATPVKAVSITQNSIALPLTKVKAKVSLPSDDDFIFDNSGFDLQGLPSLFQEGQKPFVYKKETCYLFGERIGGRNLFDVNNGRSYVGSTVGGNKQPQGFEFQKVTFDRYNVPDKVSPYVLMPDDKLAVACIVQPAPYDPSEYLGSDESEIDEESYLKQPSIELNIPKFKTRISGPGRIVLYGTYLRDGEPISPESSQPLTSLSIHEDVRGDVSPYGGSYCMDQFTLEPRTSLRNGYLDRIVVGNVIGSLSLPFANVDEVDDVDARYASGSVVDGTSRFKKGLQRFVRLVNDRETYYDSHVPQLQAVLNAFGIVERNVDIQLDPEVQQPSPNPTGLLFFSPFDPSLSTDQRSDNVRDAVKGSTAAEFALKSFQVTSGSTEIFDLKAENFDPISPNSLTPKQIISLIYGALDYNYDGSSSEIDEAQRVLDILRGYRYGLMSAFPLGRSACFRHDRYGQFRDMFETSPDSILYEEVELDGGAVQRGLGNPPVRVRFVKRGSQELVLDPEQTNSQNLSVFATSSLPYFDGAARDRSTLQPDLVRPEVVINTVIL